MRKLIQKQLSNSKLFNEYLKKVVKYGKGHKDIALQPIVISPNADDQLKRIFVLLNTLKCGNNIKNILSKFNELLGQLYKDQKISKLLYK